MSDPTASARGPRVLVVSRQHAHPPRNGGALREMHIIRALAALGPTWVFALAAGGPPPPGLPVAGWTSSRDRNASMPEGGDVMAALRDGRSPFHVTVSETAARELLALVDEFAPDVVVVRGNEIATYVPHLRATGARLIVDADYAFAEAIATMGAGDSNRARGITWRHAASLVARVEAETVALVDQIWVAHTRVAGLPAAPRYPDAPSITVVPNVVDVGFVLAVAARRPLARRLPRSLRLLAERRRGRHTHQRRPAAARAGVGLDRRHGPDAMDARASPTRGSR